ncbi:hypothetical protein K525DRAFT_364937 [Schizophyllum commune Loenen D]|nr:hypothetical protein K525DRAFT_364937 [Schizophyllum commune Loenen D]
MASYMYGQPAGSAPFQHVAQRGLGHVSKHQRPPGFVNGPVRKQQKFQKQQQQQKHPKSKHGGRATGLNPWTVLNEIEHAIQQTQIHAQYNPFDIKAQNDYHVLCQLRAVVQAGVAPGDLQAIHTQLRTLVAPRMPAPPVWSSQPPPPAPVPVQYPPVVNQPVPAPQSLSLQNALLGLVRSGVIGTSNQQGSSSSVKPESTGTRMDVDDGPEVSESGKYRRKIMRQKVSLRDIGHTSGSPRNVLESLFYDNLPVQCRQCAQRFSDSTEGKQAHQKHLDMHFRQNRQHMSNEGRGFSRSLYVDREDWVTSVDPNGKQRALEQERESKAEAARRKEELLSRHVIIPIGDETKPLSCPVCFDPFRTEFLEDEEEWVWTNAMKDGETLYHATCHAELHTKTRASSRSRSRTPEASSRKRKAEDGGHDIARPSKRISL